MGFGADNFDQTVEVFDLKVVKRAWLYDGLIYPVFLGRTCAASHYNIGKIRLGAVSIGDCSDNVG